MGAAPCGAGRGRARRRVRRGRRGVARDAVAPRRGLRARRARDQRREVRVVRMPPAGDGAPRARDARRGAAPAGGRRLERRRDGLGAPPVPRHRLGVRGEAAGPA